MPAPIVIRNLTPETKMGNESPKIATREDLRDGARGDSGSVVTPPPNTGGPDLSGLSLIAETGFTVNGTLADLGEITISGQDFGQKAPQRHFDRIDRYWNNGVEVENPYYALAEDAKMPVGQGYPMLGNLWAEHGRGWRVKAEAARPGRSKGYQLESDENGLLEGYCTGGFAGWPADQRDAEVLYLRQWRYMLYPPTDKTLEIFNGEGADLVLAQTLQAGATSLSVPQAPRINLLGNGTWYEFYILLDNGEMFRATKVAPTISSTAMNFEPPLPSQASAGNPIYIRSNSAHKELRIRDGNSTGGNWNVYKFAGFQDSTSNIKWQRRQDRPFVSWEEGKWELWEHFLVAPKMQADFPNKARIFTRINGETMLDVRGDRDSLGGSFEPTPLQGWPSSGVAVTLWGYEDDRPHFIPGNKFRLSDIYLDNSLQRVEVGIGNDDLYQCGRNREVCPIRAWNGQIKFLLNALPFTAEQMAQARLFVVDENDTPTLIARVAQQ